MNLTKEEENYITNMLKYRTKTYKTWIENYKFHKVNNKSRLNKVLNGLDFCKSILAKLNKLKRY